MEKHVVLITGAASGLGRAVAERFADQGAEVALLDLPGTGLETLSRRLREGGGNVMYVHADVTSEAEVSRAIDAVMERFGRITVLVNSAGVFEQRTIVSEDGPHPLDMFERVMSVNVFGTFNVLRLVVDRMVRASPDDEGERGVIINVSSIAGLAAPPGMIAYAASKGAVVSMTLPLARELAEHGIRVNDIAAGLFDTPMADKEFPTEAAKAALRSFIPFPKRFGKEEEFVQVVESLVLNRYFNGATIRLDASLH